MSRTRCIPDGGGTEAGFKSPHWSNCLRQWRSIWGCWRVQQLICGNLNKMRTTQTTLATAIHTLDRDTSLLDYAAAGSCSIGIGEKSQGEVCCWLQGDGLKGCTEGDCSGKCLWKKTEQPWRQGNNAESYSRSVFFCSLSFPTCQCQQLPNRERS